MCDFVTNQWPHLFPIERADLLSLKLSHIFAFQWPHLLTLKLPHVLPLKSSNNITNKHTDRYAFFISINCIRQLSKSFPIFFSEPVYKQVCGRVLGLEITCASRSARKKDTKKVTKNDKNFHFFFVKFKNYYLFCFLCISLSLFHKVSSYRPNINKMR